MKWFAGVALAAVAARATSQPFMVSTQTSWPAPPLVLEVLETAYDANPQIYFPLLHILSKHFLALGPDPTAQQILDNALGVIEAHNLPPVDKGILELGLALHVATPRLEAAYSQYALIDEDHLGVADCSAWVEWRGKGFCDVQQLMQDIERTIEDGSHDVDQERPPLLPLDRPSNSIYSSGPQAFFYYSPTEAALPFLSYLESHSRSHPQFQYVVRYRAPMGKRETHTPVAGYGVELALKKTDYLVIDDRLTEQNGGAEPESNHIHGGSNSSDPLASILGDDPWSELAVPLTANEVKNLGLKAVALINNASSPLDAFVSLTQDFPKYTAALARRVQVPFNIRKRAQRLSVRHPIGPVFYVNGQPQKEQDINAFGLLQTIRQEHKLLSTLLSVGFTPEQAYHIISDPIIGAAQAERDPLEGLIDASDREEGEQVICWMNDIENDPQYFRMSKNIKGYLRPLYPGQLHMVKQNTWNAVLVLDISTMKGLEAILGGVGVMIQRGVPIRFGIVPMLDDLDSPAATLAKVYYYLSEESSPTAAQEYLRELIPMTGISPGTTSVQIDEARDIYERMRNGSLVKGLSWDEIQDSPKWQARLAANQAYVDRLGATRAESSSGHMFINGKHSLFTSQWTQQLQLDLALQLNHIQQVLSQGADIDDSSIATYFYDLPSTQKRRSKFVVPSEKQPLRAYNLQEVFNGEAEIFRRSFIYPTGEESEVGTPLSMWVVGDLDTAEGRGIVKKALQHLQTERCSSRLAFVHVPNPNKPTQIGIQLSTLLYQLISTDSLGSLGPGQLVELLDELESAISSDNVTEGGKVESEGRSDRADTNNGRPLNKYSSFGWSSVDTALAAEFWNRGTIVANSLKLKTFGPHILSNGRLIGPLTPAAFSLDDFNTFEVYEMAKRTGPVVSAIQRLWGTAPTLSRPELSDVISLTSSVLASSYSPQGAEGVYFEAKSPRSRAFEQLDDGDMSFTVGNPETALINIAVVIDPVSELAQRWAPLLKMLAGLDGTAITVYFDPNIEAKEVTIKRFYRAALRSKLSFDIDGNEIAPIVTFTNLPEEPILTLAMDVPDSWLVRPKESHLDLDNLMMGTLNEPTHVRFDLQSLVIAGHAENENGSPPRGLQLQLLKGPDVVSDTQVMANLGYFQFKATPGVYQLNIRPGRGQTVYEMESSGAQGYDSPPINVTGTSLALASFDGVTIFPRFAHRPGMEFADVLQEDVQEVPFTRAVLDRMKEMVGLSTHVKNPSARHADINIFTVASGLLYERFASIMMLSVMKHTQHSVKFWFIENFLSPTFIKFLPEMAKEYGFQYELVTYKWPSWLRAQTEKQRIIWAYKILFLDVLFPMDLDKIIFVDADQIVRVDMQELVDVNLHGHVYGYPPMGDSRREMEGFRFWKTGYWKKELAGLPYHISALYVVDLKLFRQRATGDRLRGQYHALSADPNSLANLDQDLPNSMQHTIPIFTLEQDWLWCQTWCSDESLQTAKTIDLCQNPLTKEPKLVRARQIPEWDSYDREIARFAATLDNGGAFSGNVDDLASGPAAKTHDKEQINNEPAAEAISEPSPSAQDSEDNAGRIADEL